MGGVTRYRKNVFLGIFWTATDHSPAYLETYTVNDKLGGIHLLYGQKSCVGFYLLLAVTIETIEILSWNWNQNNCVLKWLKIVPTGYNAS